MENYKNFGIGTIVWAYYLDTADEARIQKDIDYFKSKMPLNKAYLENHRGLVDVSNEKISRAREIFEKNGIEVSGCITSTGLVGERKPSIFDTYCFTDPADRAEYVKIVENLASLVDEIILDDYFFCSCRCEKCIKAKGNRSWAEYRLDLMEDFSKIIVNRAKAINPKMNFIIKYPNWAESWHETGYNPEKQKDIFDMVYTGTETRDPVHSQQHMQRYLSYSAIRYLENVAPGRNGGGWIDPFDTDLKGWFEQADLTLLAGAKELMLFNFEEMTTNNLFPPLGEHLKETDRMLDLLKAPNGVSVYEPYNGDGEDLLYTYLGMCGIPMEPRPEFAKNEPVVFLTKRACVDSEIMNKVEEYVRLGGNAVITTGFMREEYDKGIKEMTSLRFTGRYMAGSHFMINYRNHTDFAECDSQDEILFEVLQYKTNASWSDVSVVSGEYNFPVLSEDNYGKGRLFILNIPNNFADLYKLPKAVKAAIGKFMTLDREVYAASDDKCSLFVGHDNTFALLAHTERSSTVRVYVRDICKGIENIETGECYNEVIALPKPGRWFDGCTIMPEADEYAVDLPVTQGKIALFRVIR